MIERPRPDKDLEELIVVRDPRVAKEIVRDIDMGKQVCGGRFGFEWSARSEFSGAFQAYCQKPNCIDTGECTGPVFVPSFPQYTHLDEEHPLRTRRRLGDGDGQKAVREITEGLSIVTREAQRHGAIPDTRTLTEILHYAGAVMKKVRQQIQGGGWRQS